MTKDWLELRGSRSSEEPRKWPIEAIDSVEKVSDERSAFVPAICLIKGGFVALMGAMALGVDPDALGPWVGKLGYVLLGGGGLGVVVGWFLLRRKPLFGVRVFGVGMDGQVMISMDEAETERAVDAVRDVLSKGAD